MPGLLIDTHIWIWYAEGIEGRLRQSIIDELDAALSAGNLLVSAVSVWEIGLLVAKGRISLSLPLRDWVRCALELPGLRLVPLGADAALEGSFLPGELHADPADRLLIAQARIGQHRLVTADHKLIDYGTSGHLKVLQAS